MSARAAEELEQPPALAEFRAFMRDGDYYVPTINGFPFGAFHRERVKENVYLPDWRDRRRVDYTNRLANLLAALLRDRGIAEGSVSTVPGAFKGHLHAPDDAAAIAAGILDHAAHLVDVTQVHGRDDRAGHRTRAGVLHRNGRRGRRLLHAISVR